MTREPAPTSRYVAIARWGLVALLAAAALYLVTLVFLGGQPVFASLLLGVFAIAAYVYTARRAHTYRYLFPGLAGMAIFVLFPLVYTAWIGFTNYSSSNLLTFERARGVLLQKAYQSSDTRYEMVLYRDGERFRLGLGPERVTGDEPSSIFEDAGAEEGGAGASAPDGSREPEPGPSVEFISAPVALDDRRAKSVEARAVADSDFTPGEPLSMREVIGRRRALDAVTVVLPDGTRISKLDLRTFTARSPLYIENPDGSLTDQKTGAVLRANHETGFYETESGERITPGFRVTVGFAHFVRIFTDDNFQGPFLRIFWWTVLFSALSVFFSLIVGLLLAELLDWEELRFRGLYRVLLFLPYAVPGFISILVFKGLFNQNFGEINRILDALFGISPEWFSDPFLAKVMLVIVNTWLGYPYIMLLCMGLRKSIPKDLYEASALAGAGPLDNFFKITWPLIRKPLTPLLVSSFAFNFNNFVLVALLTGGRPDFLDTVIPAGETDILVSYTYRIAFEDSGKNFGLAAAISTVIFFMVAILSIINLRLTKASQSETR